MKIKLIANPIAGGNALASIRRAQEFLERQGCTVALTLTGARGDAGKAAAKAKNEGFDRIVAAGGDGTLNEVINGLAPSVIRDPALARERGEALHLVPVEQLAPEPAYRAFDRDGSDLGSDAATRRSIENRLDLGAGEGRFSLPERQERQSRERLRGVAGVVIDVARLGHDHPALVSRERAESELARLTEELAVDPVPAVRAKLESAVEVRIAREKALGEARNGVESAAGALRALEEERLQAESRLAPLRERIGELRLKEQAAQINRDQFDGQLREARADDGRLAAEAESAPRPSALQGEITRLAQAVAELGAVNLAAPGELQTSQERKGFLDAQAADLEEAVQTLEDAIRRIDRETRELLRETFDSVNRHFGSLFPVLFGGGEAKLLMTGEEILDAGVQVMAHPPGKRNSSIHLLSGGEKALTAIALVFSMFQLNPAPFCLLDEVDAPLDDTNTVRFCDLVRRMSAQTQFLFISHNKITMEMAAQLIGVTMPESGVSRVVAVDIEEALRIREELAA